MAVSEKENKVMVIDNVERDVKVLTEILGRDYDVFTAVDATDVLGVLKCVESKQIDLILFSITGDIYEFEVYRKLKEELQLDETQIIFMVPECGKQERDDILDFGGNDYITKPFDPVLVKIKVKSHLNLLRTMRSAKVLHERNNLIVDSAGYGLFEINMACNFSYVNPSGARMLGWQPEELRGKAMHRVFHLCCEDGIQSALKKCPLHVVVQHKQTYHNADDLFWKRDGSMLPVDFILTPMIEDGAVVGAVAAFKDITYQKDQEKQFVRSLSSRVAISALAETSIEPLSIHKQVDVALDILLTVPWLSPIRKGSIFLVDDTSENLILHAYKNFDKAQIDKCRTVARGQCLCGLVLQKKELVFSGCTDERHTITYDGMVDHGHYCVPITVGDSILGVLNVYTEVGRVTNPEYDAFLSTFCQTLANIIRYRSLEAGLAEAMEQLEYTANHDKLTGIPNRRLFHELLNQHIMRAKRDNEKVAVMFVDLDKFKPVNDTYGHETGDLLLQSVAKRLKGLLRDSDTVARIGGDEFVIVLQSVIDQSHLALVAEKIIHEINQPFNLKENICHIGCSIGISLFPDHGENFDVLLKKADMALYLVKEQGRNNHQVYVERDA